MVEEILTVLETHRWIVQSGYIISLTGLPNFSFQILTDEVDYMPSTAAIQIRLPCDSFISFTDGASARYGELLKRNNVYLKDDLIRDAMAGRVVRIDLPRSNTRTDKVPFFLQYPYHKMRDCIMFPNAETAMLAKLEYPEWF